MTLEEKTGNGHAARQNGRMYEPDSPSRRNLSLRDQYLIYCGFKRDPFRTPVAEQEYGLSDVASQRFDVAHKAEAATGSIFTARAYYVDPRYESRRVGSVFDELRAPGHIFVYGQPGAGKSTLRFALEAHLRGRPDGKTLAVTYEPEEELREYRLEGQSRGDWSNSGRAPSSGVHLRLLARALTIDLFVQIVEQFDYREQPPTEEQNRCLYDLFLNLDPNRQKIMRRVIARLKSDQGPEPSPVWGLAGLWGLLDRPIVRPVVRTSKLRQWLEQLPEMPSTTARSSAIGSTQWARVLDTAREWGFSHICILVDGLDALQPRPSYMRGRLGPLLALLPTFGARGISLKFFLPAELEDDVTKRLAQPELRAAYWSVVRLEWSPERLQALIMERYRAGGARRGGLGDLVTPDTSDEIDDWLIREAHGSPRRLVTLVDELIEAHVVARGGRGDIKTPITPAEVATAIRNTNARLGAPLRTSGGNQTTAGEDRDKPEATRVRKQITQSSTHQQKPQAEVHAGRLSRLVARFWPSAAGETRR